jgi:hypothetical protein
MKENNQGTSLFTNLLNEIGDIKSELIKPDDFAERSHYARRVLLEEMEAYLFERDVYHLHRYQELKGQLDLLLARANEAIAIHKEITGNLDISPYRASLAMYVSTQLSEALAIIHPDNMVKGR